MEKQKITINTLPVTIKVIEVGGKKMTISVLKQIPYSPFLITGLGEDELNSSYLGWVKNNDEKFILFFRDNVLLKYRVPEGFTDYEIKKLELLEPYLERINQIYIAI